MLITCNWCLYMYEIKKYSVLKFMQINAVIGIY